VQPRAVLQSANLSGSPTLGADAQGGEPGPARQRYAPASMSSRYVRNLDAAAATHEFPGVTDQVVELGDITVTRQVLEPGWRWSTHVRPHVGTDSCRARHVGVVLSGRLGIRLDDGSTFEIGPNDVYEIPPGHDGYVIGDEPVVGFEWAGIGAFYGHHLSWRGRALATLLFTDLVGSTEAARRLGEAAWREVLSGHFEAVRQELDRFQGREVKTTGDGVLATFDGPAQALRCAARIGQIARRDGLHIRASVHVGEVETVSGDVRGVAVHEAARIMDRAGPDEILVSETTRALALPSGLEFDDRGLHVLKGLAGERRLYAFAAPPDLPT
jgi:class 3 adenylate cyclase/mannose-6-phosphate isomerase-like protein (cupin superfamily)